NLMEYEAMGVSDINHDGYGDILINSYSGTAIVYKGSDTGIISEPYWSLPQLSTNSEAFMPTKRKIELGDFNGDESIDFAVYEFESDFELEWQQNILYTEKVYIIYSQEYWGLEYFDYPYHLVYQTKLGNYSLPGESLY